MISHIRDIIKSRNDIICNYNQATCKYMYSPYSVTLDECYNILIDIPKDVCNIIISYYSDIFGYKIYERVSNSPYNYVCIQIHLFGLTFKFLIHHNNLLVVLDNSQKNIDTNVSNYIYYTSIHNNTYKMYMENEYIYDYDIKTDTVTLRTNSRIIRQYVAEGKTTKKINDHVLMIIKELESCSDIRLDNLHHYNKLGCEIIINIP